MRTNIEIDDELMRQAMAASGETTKRAVVEAGLRLLVRLKAQQVALALHGTVDWQGDLDASREGRDAGRRNQIRRSFDVSTHAPAWGATW